MKNLIKPQTVQGEGDYKSAERYDESVRTFVKAGKVPDAVKKAEPETAQVMQELEEAEQIGLSHSKSEDPGIKSKTSGKP
jgi:hypothetical protein